MPRKILERLLKFTALRVASGGRHEPALKVCKGSFTLEEAAGLPGGAIGANGGAGLPQVRRIANGGSVETVYRILSSLRGKSAPLYRGHEVRETQPTGSASFAAQPVLKQPGEGQAQIQAQGKTVLPDSPLWRYAAMEASGGDLQPQSRAQPPDPDVLLWLSTLLDPAPVLPAQYGNHSPQGGEVRAAEGAEAAMQWYSSLGDTHIQPEAISPASSPEAEGDALRWLSDLAGTEYARGQGAAGPLADGQRVCAEALRAFAVIPVPR